MERLLLVSPNIPTTTFLQIDRLISTQARMCFNSCVSIDPETGVKHIPASARVDPSSLPFHPLPAAAAAGSSDAKVMVTIFHLGTIGSYRQAWADDTWDDDHMRRAEKAKQPVELPILSALIEHEPTGEKWLWDLGLSNVR